MIILGIESATLQVGCAVGGYEGVWADFHASRGRRHAEILTPAIEHEPVVVTVGGRGCDLVDAESDLAHIDSLPAKLQLHRALSSRRPHAELTATVTERPRAERPLPGKLRGHSGESQTAASGGSVISADTG